MYLVAFSFVECNTAYLYVYPKIYLGRKIFLMIEINEKNGFVN